MWWEGYKGEEVVLFDDYRGESGFSEMLRLTHEYSAIVPVKGGSVRVNPAWFIFTTNEPWTLWAGWKSFDKTPWERRVTDHFDLKWVLHEGAQAVAVTTLKGNYENYADAPDQDEEATLKDEEVEDILALPPTSKWLKRRVYGGPAEAPPEAKRGNHGQVHDVANQMDLPDQGSLELEIPQIP